MPVRFIYGGECPHEIANIQARIHVDVFNDVRAVIKHEKSMMSDWGVEEQRGQCQQEAQQNRFLVQFVKPSLQCAYTRLQIYERSRVLPMVFLRSAANHICLNQEPLFARSQPLL